MDVCVENVFTTPTIEAINVIQAAAEENDRAASSDPHHGHQETDAEQETVARGNVAQGFSPEDSAAIADSSEMSQAEAAEKNPWSAWAWMGLFRTREDKNYSARIPNIVHFDVDQFFASVEQVLYHKLRGKIVLVERGCVTSADYK